MSKRNASRSDATVDSSSVKALRLTSRDRLLEHLQQLHAQGGRMADEALELAKPCLGRVQKLGQRLRQEFARRDEAVDLLIASAIAGTPVVLFGPPGTGKTRLVRRLGELCGLVGGAHGEASGYFEYLLTQHTMPEELFGPPDIQELQAGRFQRVTQNMLPTAQLAFLDEIFRGGSHILNTLLTIINERRFHDGAQTYPVPLLQVVGAANHPPEDPELAAFYDRFPLRLWVDSVFSGAGETGLERASDLLDKSSTLGESDGALVPGESVEPVASILDFWTLRLHLLLAMRWDPSATPARQAFLRRFLRYREHGWCNLSDRSLRSLSLVARANVLFRNGFGGIEEEREPDLLDVFRHTAPDQARARLVREDLGDAAAGPTSRH